jgi:hypothetical protein
MFVMELLTKWTIWHGDRERTIELFRGDLAKLPQEHAVDLLVVSAFANDYLPTFTSLVGSLYDAGVSVQDLADDKEMDLREQFSCWLSHPLPHGNAFRRILCIESGWRGTPPEITDDLFRALSPYLLTTFPNASVAMPLIGAGDQGWPVAQMMESILNTAVSWIDRGLQLRILKIVVRSEQTAKSALDKFHEIRQRFVSDQLGQSNISKRGFDLFMSYCHKDLETAQTVLTEIRRLCPTVQIFFDRDSLPPGCSWLSHVAESLDNSKRVAALYTPDYWGSPSCKDEFAAAMARQNDIGNPVLFPIYVHSAKIPYLFRNVEYVDCREGDKHKIIGACHSLAQCLV